MSTPDQKTTQDVSQENKGINIHDALKNCLYALAVIALATQVSCDMIRPVITAPTLPTQVPAVVIYTPTPIPTIHTTPIYPTITHTPPGIKPPEKIITPPPLSPELQKALDNFYKPFESQMKVIPFQNLFPDAIKNGNVFAIRGMFGAFINPNRDIVARDLRLITSDYPIMHLLPSGELAAINGYRLYYRDKETDRYFPAVIGVQNGFKVIRVVYYNDKEEVVNVDDLSRLIGVQDKVIVINPKNLPEGSVLPIGQTGIPTPVKIETPTSAPVPKDLMILGGGKDAGNFIYNFRYDAYGKSPKLGYILVPIDYVVKKSQTVELTMSVQQLLQGPYKFIALGEYRLYTNIRMDRMNNFTQIQPPIECILLARYATDANMTLGGGTYLVPLDGQSEPIPWSLAADQGSVLIQMINGQYPEYK